jgi:hypothetical protein
MIKLSRIALCLYLVTRVCPSLLLGQTRPVDTRDCVSVRYITGDWLSPDGETVAYVVR